MMLFRRAMSTAASSSSFLVRQARRRALLNQQQLPPVTGPVQGLWRQLLMRDEMRSVRSSVTEGLLKSLRHQPAVSEGSAPAVSAEDFATAVPQAVPRALRLVWKREQRWLALRRRGHTLPDRVAALRRDTPELARTLASFVARHDAITAGTNPLFGEATLHASVLPKRRQPPKDAAAAYKDQLYQTALANLRLLLARAKPPPSA
jgi:hypothetical protein